MKSLDMVLLPSLSQTIQSIEQETHYVFLLIEVQKKEVLKAVYIFKDEFTRWDSMEEKAQVIRLVSSVYDVTETETDAPFFKGFIHSLNDLLSMKKDYGILNIDTIGHNSILLEHWRRRFSLHMETEAAYYLYNWIYPQSPVNNQRVFLF
jgi:hypothetical protein